ncbi:MAG: nucleotidyltransferase family protein, partial [Thermomicrobiales bacterium]
DGRSRPSAEVPTSHFPLPTSRLGRPWPTPEQALLLRASLGDSEEALAAWEAWRAATDLDRLDGGSFQLLPLLYRNLVRLGIGEAAPDFGRLRGVYRLTWYKNRVGIAHLATLIGQLDAAGIPTMVLKGAALLALYYRDHGARGMGDCDLLVPVARAREALAVVERHGWSPEIPDPTRWLAASSSVGFSGPAGTALDFHWHPLWEIGAPDADGPLWARAQPATIGGAATLAPAPSDLLLHVCVHGARWHPSPPFRWVADALVILRESGDALDWASLVAEAERLHLVMPMRATLRYLRRRWHAPVPEWVLTHLRALPVAPTLRLEYVAHQRPRGLWQKALIAWSHARRAVGYDHPLRAVAILPARLQALWGLEHPWQIPAHAIRVGRLRRAGMKGEG